MDWSLFFPLQINKTDYPIKFSKDTPFLQIVPFDRNAAARAENRSNSLLGLSDLTDDLWTGLRENAVRRNTEPPGSYRRRRGEGQELPTGRPMVRINSEYDRNRRTRIAD